MQSKCDDQWFIGLKKSCMQKIKDLNQEIIKLLAFNPSILTSGTLLTSRVHIDELGPYWRAGSLLARGVLVNKLIRSSSLTRLSKIYACINVDTTGK